jgi:hypothetical protein
LKGAHNHSPVGPQPCPRECRHSGGGPKRPPGYRRSRIKQCDLRPQSEQLTENCKRSAVELVRGARLAGTGRANVVVGCRAETATREPTVKTDEEERSMIRSRKWAGFRSVLCAIDFSEHSRQALRYAVVIAELRFRAAPRA